LHLGSQERFFSADESFLFKGESSASIINNGDLRALNARDDASVTFIAAQIENYGRIKARHVGLAAGSQVRLDLGAGFSIAVEKAAIDAKIEQGGAIQADGGRLILNAQTANDLLATVVNHDGISEATALTKDAAGDIYLVGNAGVRISENSQLSAAAKKPGRVTIKADHLTQAGKIDASASGAAQAGGEVLLDVSERFNNSGVITANSANEDGGSISISAKNITETSRALYQADGFLSGGDITLTGSTEVFSSADFTAIGHQVNGGRIDITAPDTRLLSNSITASGALKGGLVRLGGAFQGGKTPNTTESLRQSFVDRWGSLPDLSSAQSFFANDGVSIDVSSVKGQGGTAVAWSDQQTTFLGEIIAKGAQNGGSVEISSENNLRYVGLETIETGQGGHLLLDPKNITLGDAADASGWNYNGVIGVGYSGDKNLDKSQLTATRRFGEITVAATNVSSDRAGAVRGRAVILSGNIEQHQRIARSAVLKSRLVFQAASSQNLNSLEGFSLGGAYGIRAYPVGEASGSNGFLGQFELHEPLTSVSAAYLFLDFGQVAENAGENTPRLAGAGLGVQFSNKRLSLDLSLSRRLSMAASSVDPSNRDPQFWTSVNINF